MVTKAAGTAGDDLSLQLFQATDVSGAGEKPLAAIRKVYYKVGTQTGVSTFGAVAVSPASADVDTVSVNGATDLGGDSVQALFVFDVRASDLDVDNGFDCVRFNNDGTDVANAVYGTVHYILYNARYPQATPLSAIVD